MEKKDYTVHLDVDITGTGERNDFLVEVEASSVSEAVERAKLKLQQEQEYEDEDMEEAEILDVYPDHVKSVWDRPGQKPS